MPLIQEKKHDALETEASSDSNLKNMFQSSEQNPFTDVKDPSLIPLIYNVNVIHGKL